MTFRYRSLIILTIIWTALSFNIERPDTFYLLGNINIASFVYALVILSMLFLLVFLQFSFIRLRYILPVVLGIYLLSKIVTYESDIDPARFVYLSVFEVVILVVSVLMIKELAKSISQFNLAIESSLIKTNHTSVLETGQGELAIRKKIERARRFNRGLVMIYVSIKPLNDKSRRQWDQEEKVRYMYLQLQIAELIHFLIDITDVSMWHHDNLIVCLNETSKENAEKQASQIQQVLRDVMKLETSVGISMFPDDGLMYQDMLRISMSNTLMV